MGNINSRHVLSLLIAAGGCIAGAYSAFAAFANGKTIAEGTAGIIFGLAFAAVVIISWIMLPWADKRQEEGAYRDAWLWRMSWLMALGFVLANSVAYCAHYRTEMIEVKGLQIEAYERARHIEETTAAELNSLRTNFRWSKTSGCSNVYELKSKRFCDHFKEVQSKLQEAQTLLSQGRPGSKDAGAEILGWVLGVDEAKIRRSLPIFWAIILELIASLCMREAFATVRLPAQRFGDKVKLGDAGVMARKAVAPKTNAFATAMVGGVTLFGGKAFTQFQQHALNDNMPFAAYA